MVVAEIVGGLGNQLFQFAAAKALADQHQVPLKLDISFFEKSKRSFMLDNFNCNASLVDDDELQALQKKNLLEKIRQRTLPNYKKVPFYEPHYHFYPGFFKAPAKTYLKGLWQSEKYFSSIKNTIVKEFELKPHLVAHLKDNAKAMQNEESIAIHIRRGDYLHPRLQQHYGLLSAEYYLNALSVITKKHPGAKIYFFSDDIDFVKEFVTENNSFHYDYECITGNITTTDLEDFYLMQNCRHNITANSTFSWWAAWLNRHKDKIIVAPKQWYKNPKVNYKDLIPDRWFCA